MNVNLFVILSLIIWVSILVGRLEKGLLFIEAIEMNIGKIKLKS